MVGGPHDGESPADRRYREWKDRQKEALDKGEISYGDAKVHGGRAVHGRDSCLVVTVALLAVFTVMLKGVTGL